MMGLPTNERPDCFWQADVTRPRRRWSGHPRGAPAGLVTYDENGGYGHPDHIQAHRVAMRGVELAADPSPAAGEPWEVAKIYWNAMPESWMREGLRRLREAGDTTAFEGHGSRR